MSFDPDELPEHLDVLYRYAVGVTRDPGLAEDVVQETVLRALERRDQYRRDAQLSHWLIRIAHNLIVDRARRSSREILVDAVENDWRDDAFTVDADAVIEQAATRAELLDALARLPFIYRSAVVLHDVEGLRVSDIAEISGVSLPAAKQRLRRGRMALVSALATGHERRLALEGVPMPCWDARRHVSDYLNGELDTDTRSMIETHLATCPTCPPLYAALVGVSDELGQLRDPDSVINPEIEARARAAIASPA
ncbi:MAG: sigma-70 family RNA polymerase sigma factor [Acidimicrobiales bacterium]|jgi:RNA polymerase sigma-70 factor (ECF subfamily)|nr:sigma-70 family RNA polymerase sigma factor [Acidimicrobiales bacterium]